MKSLRIEQCNDDLAGGIRIIYLHPFPPDFSPFQGEMGAIY